MSTSRGLKVLDFSHSGGLSMHRFHWQGNIQLLVRARWQNLWNQTFARVLIQSCSTSLSFSPFPGSMVLQFELLRKREETSPGAWFRRMGTAAWSQWGWHRLFVSTLQFTLGSVSVTCSPSGVQPEFLSHVCCSTCWMLSYVCLMIRELMMIWVAVSFIPCLTQWIWAELWQGELTAFPFPPAEL